MDVVSNRYNNCTPAIPKLNGKEKQTRSKDDLWTDRRQTVAKQKTLAERQQQVANIIINWSISNWMSGYLKIQQLCSVMSLYVEKGEPMCGKFPLSNSNKKSFITYSPTVRLSIVE